MTVKIKMRDSIYQTQITMWSLDPVRGTNPSSHICKPVFGVSDATWNGELGQRPLSGGSRKGCIHMQRKGSWVQFACVIVDP